MMGSLRFGYVGHMDHGVFEAVTVECFAARTPHERTGFLRWKLLAGCPHRIFPGGPVPCIAPLLKISLSALRQKHLPRAPEIGTGLVNGRGGAALHDSSGVVLKEIIDSLFTA
jgi:hypothetical protein